MAPHCFECSAPVYFFRFLYICVYVHYRFFFSNRQVYLCICKHVFSRMLTYIWIMTQSVWGRISAGPASRMTQVSLSRPVCRIWPGPVLILYTRHWGHLNGLTPQSYFCIKRPLWSISVPNNTPYACPSISWRGLYSLFWQKVSLISTDDEVLPTNSSQGHL